MSATAGVGPVSALLDVSRPGAAPTGGVAVALQALGTATCSLPHSPSQAGLPWPSLSALWAAGLLLPGPVCRSSRRSPLLRSCGSALSLAEERGRPGGDLDREGRSDERGCLSSCDLPACCPRARLSLSLSLAQSGGRFLSASLTRSDLSLPLSRSLSGLPARDLSSVGNRHLDGD